MVYRIIIRNHANWAAKSWDEVCTEICTELRKSNVKAGIVRISGWRKARWSIGQLRFVGCGQFTLSPKILEKTAFLQVLFDIKEANEAKDILNLPS